MSSVINMQAKPPFRMDLDSPITIWPGGSLQSLSAIFVHLEKMAVRQNREAGSIWENENVVKLHDLLSGNHRMEPGRPAGLSFRDLGRQIVETAKAQVELPCKTAPTKFSLSSSSTTGRWPNASGPRCRPSAALPFTN